MRVGDAVMADNCDNQIDNLRKELADVRTTYQAVIEAAGVLKSRERAILAILDRSGDK